MNQVKNYFHRGENVSTAVEMFTPRWKCFHRGGNYFHRGDNYFHRGGNVPNIMGHRRRPRNYKTSICRRIRGYSRARHDVVIYFA